MKVVCDACQAKYQIPDERVEGRKLKIRCRKCGGTIVVRGDGADINARASLPPSAPPEWHVSIDGEQHGPYPSEQMASMLRQGLLAWDAHVWRESYAEWKTAGESDTLVRAVAAASDDAPTFAAQAPTGPGSIDDAPTFSAPAPTGPAAASYVGDETPTRIAPPHADDLQPSARNSFAARSAQRAGTASSPNLRAVSQPPNLRPLSQPPLLSESRPPRARYSTPPLGSPQPFTYADPRVAANAALTGERHEDSVLFSTRQNVAPAVEPVARPGYAAAEGSGLIDIRALAALAQTQKSSMAPAPLAPTNGKSAHHQDDVLRMANQTGAFTRLDSLAPLDRASVAPSRALPIAIVSGCAMIAMAGVAIVYLLRAQPSPGAQPVAVNAAAVVPAAAPSVLAPTPVTEAPSVAPQPEPPQPSRPAMAEADQEQQPEPATIRGQRARAEAKPTKITLPASTASRGRVAAPIKGAKTAEPKQEPEVASTDKGKAKKEASPSIDDMLDENPKKPAPVAAKAEPEGPDPLAGIEAAAKSKEKPKTRSIDELLDDAIPVKEKKAGGGAAEASNAALPETPSRDQVIAAMRDVQAEVQACADGQSVEVSSANVSMTISGASGHVSSAQVSGIGGTVGSCIARAVRGASFPKFAKAQFSINFPFKLKK
ncbi:MAG: GYF domain-containing protein [Polyangiales bacterium]